MWSLLLPSGGDSHLMTHPISKNVTIIAKISTIGKHKAAPQQKTKSEIKGFILDECVQIWAIRKPRGKLFLCQVQVGSVTFQNVQLISVSFSQYCKLAALNNLPDKKN